MNEPRVIPKFACGVCGKTFDRREDAVTCAMKPEKPLGKVGLVFRYYDSNTSSRIVAITASNRSGHEVINSYYSVEGREVPENRQWGIQFLTDEFWKVIAQLAYQKIMPSVLKSGSVYPQEDKIVPLEDLFK